MKVSELIELLSEMPEDAEVRLAYQPSWPFEYRIDDVVLAGTGESRYAEWQCCFCDDTWSSRAALIEHMHAAHDVAREDAEEGLTEDEATGPEVVYIAEGGQIGYLPAAAARALGWGRE